MLKQVTHARRGEHVSDGASDRIAADPHGMGRPLRIYTDGVTLPGSTSGIEGDWSSGYYGYDGAGNIEKLLQTSGTLVDDLKPDDDTFTYDNVSRLTQATIATADDTFVTQAYEYDAWGNMVTYGGQSRAVSGTTNRLSNASYDARGNQTGWIWDAGYQRYRYLFGWDPLDRMTWHNGPGVNRVFAYTADGERIVERNVASGVTTISLRGLDAKVLREVKLQSGAYSWQKDYIYREGQILTSHGNNEPLQHYHLDHLGTPRMLSNRCGERLQRFEAFPFGEAIAELPQHPEKMRLTGHQRDLNQNTTTEDDLDYMHARYYGTKMGRFLGVDTANAKPGVAQTWNKYLYGLGNPVRYVDPDGRWALPWELLDLYSYNESRKAWVAAYEKLVNDPSWKNAGEAVSAFVTNMGDSAALLLPGIPATGGLTIRAVDFAMTDLAKLKDAGNVLDASDKGGSLTRVGRAIAKHAEEFGIKLGGNALAKNEMGAQVLGQILTNPGTVRIERRHARWGEIIEYISPDGRGARYAKKTGEFIGFVSGKV
jgi:RHS repeat-associated protein